MICLLPLRPRSLWSHIARPGLYPPMRHPGSLNGSGRVQLGDAGEADTVRGVQLLPPGVHGRGDREGLQGMLEGGEPGR